MPSREHWNKSFSVQGLYSGDVYYHGTGYTTSFAGKMHAFIGQIFGVPVNADGSFNPGFASWFAHVAMRNERTGDTYHLMLYDWFCY